VPSPVIIWMSPSRPIKEELELARREIGDYPVRFIRLASPEVDPMKIVRTVYPIARTREVWLVLTAAPSVIEGVLMLLAEHGLDKKVHVVVPVIQILARVPENMAYAYRRPGVGTICYRGECIVYHPLELRLVSGVTLYTKPLPA